MKKYPCDELENICPFNAIYSEDCARHCGYGVDEDSYPTAEELNLDEDYEPADIDDDCGYDPYLGCYTDDC